MSNTTVGRTVFVLGTKLEGNREVLIEETGMPYELDVDTISTYSAQTARFPYEV